MSIKRYGIVEPVPGKPRVPYAGAVEAGGWLYVSGQVGVEDGKVVPGGIVPEAHATMRNVVNALASAGYAPKDVVRAGVWLADPRDFSAFNEVYLQYFGEHLPARACVEARVMIDCKVELDCVAYKPA
jgi:reactive intermediate/imine deaminase